MRSHAGNTLLSGRQDQGGLPKRIAGCPYHPYITATADYCFHGKGEPSGLGATTLEGEALSRGAEHRAIDST